MTSDLHVPAALQWPRLLGSAATVAAEGFADDRTRNLIGGEWVDDGTPAPVVTPVDGTVLVRLPLLDAARAAGAVDRAAAQHREWG
ncbi:MAG: aldehyde dehydrogenase family protein, partial [Micromonosporaceae bacterium]